MPVFMNAALAYYVLVEREYVAVPDTEPRGVELEIRLLFRSYPYTYINRHVHQGVEVLQLVHVVQHGDEVVPA